MNRSQEADLYPCHHFHPDNVFNRFQVVEVPTSFVELSTSIELDVEVNLNTSAYIKTTYNGLLLKFDDARKLSPSHRAYEIEKTSHNTIKIIFNPRHVCISNARHGKHGNRFVFDLRLIRVDDTRCCNLEFHSEIGRYYICGQYEHCDITHFPNVIDFGDIIMNTAVTRHAHIRNNSRVLAAKFYFIKATGFIVNPASFTLAPQTSKRLTISIKPVCLKFKHCCVFKIKNPDDEFIESSIDDNSLTYNINVKLNVIHCKKQKIIVVESLHKLVEPEIKYTYVGEEIEKHLKHKAKAADFLQLCKASKKMVPTKEKFCTGTVRCYSEESVKVKLPKNNKYNFCKRPPEKVDTYDVFNIFILPFSLDFGRVGVDTYGEHDITIKNNTKYEVTIRLCNDDCIQYTSDRVQVLKLKLMPFTEVNVDVFRRGFVEGLFEGTFEYTIDNKYRRKHPYKLQVGTPTVLVTDKYLKFGMVTNESFIVSVPLRISNYFNVPVKVHWEGINSDTPFEIIPMTGTIPSRSSKISDVIYACKHTKSKVHEVELISNDKKVIPIELSVMTRKLSIKFLQPAVLFKDIALNLETIEKVKLENSSREIAVFYVIEPLIPGLKIEPMSGAIRPKMIITFQIIVQIACVLEFALDVCVRINNKENLILPVSGNVLEPKILIYPKNIYMARVPCNMVTYVPVTFQNLSTLRSEIEVLDTGDENIFNTYIAVGYEKQRVYKFCIEGGQSKTVFIRVYDIFRREYEMYIPFKINGLLGPPGQRSSTTELRHYIGEYEEQYKNNPKVKLKNLNKDISFCRIVGVITVPWVKLSVDEFEMDYMPNGNTIDFSITNVSKYYLYVAIYTAKLAPSFCLSLQRAETNVIITETHIKFELDRGNDAELSVKFNPKGHGKHVATAVLYLDKQMTLPYYNLTFTGRKQTPLMTPSVCRIIFPPCQVGTKIRRTFIITLEEESTIAGFYCVSKEESSVITNFTACEIIQDYQKAYTVLTVEVVIFSDRESRKTFTVTFCHQCGSGCDVEISFCFTYCLLTVHSNFLVPPEDHPYPYFPLETQQDLYEYMNTCVEFIEKWMFQQGFRRDLYPVIPDTFHAISSSLAGSGTKTKGINVSFLNFVRRAAAGPLMKHIHKVSGASVDESFRSVKEIHDTYQEVINLLKSRGAELWGLQAKFLLSHEQFILYCENVVPKCNADIILMQELLDDIDLFQRLNKQSWVDFILQSYKVFIMDSCFFECVCVTSQPRNIVDIIVGWYNEQIQNQHIHLRGRDKPVKVITNITTDLSDGIAVISAIINFCPFMKEYFDIFCEVTEADRGSGIINNACLIIETLNQLKINFPITSKDFFQPNFLQMLFFSLHLFIVLPMFYPKGYIKFNPPLLRTSTRQVAISPTTQESLIFNCNILNNNRNNFVVEKAPAGDNGKKLYVSIKYTANFVEEENAILLVHGYNKTRIFDTYIIFVLNGAICALNPHRKCRVTGLLYRPNRVDVLVSSPFLYAGTYKLYITDTEPTIPVKFEENTIPRFYVQRLNLIDREITLPGLPKESGQEVPEHKLYMQIICLSAQIGNSWIWFRGEHGDFFIKVTSQPRWDSPLDTLQAAARTWPSDMNTCGPGHCGESCDCYQTATITIPHRNELMVKALRYALLEHASTTMMNIFDNLIDTCTGKMILEMLLTDDGTNMSDVRHILQNEIGYSVSSRGFSPRTDYVKLAIHTSAMLDLPVSIPGDDKSEKYTVILTSDCGMDIRTYRTFSVGQGGYRCSEGTVARMLCAGKGKSFISVLYVNEKRWTRDRI